MDENTKIEISLYTGRWTGYQNQFGSAVRQNLAQDKAIARSNSAYEVNTPTVVASVRGTGFGVDANDKDATITVDDGKVNTKLVDRSGPEIKVLHEINVVKTKKLKLTAKNSRKLKIRLRGAKLLTLNLNGSKKKKWKNGLKTVVRKRGRSLR